MPEYDPMREAAEAREADADAMADTTSPAYDPFEGWRPAVPLEPGTTERRIVPRKKSRQTWRTLVDRIRQVGTVPVEKIPLMKTKALEAGLDPFTIERMDVGDLFALYLFLQGMDGKPAATNLVMEAMKSAMAIQYKGGDNGERDSAVAFYDAVIESPDATYADKLRARQAKSELLGLVAIEPITAEDFARNVREAMRGMDETVPENETAAALEDAEEPQTVEQG